MRLSGFKILVLSVPLLAGCATQPIPLVAHNDAADTTGTVAPSIYGPEGGVPRVAVDCTVVTDWGGCAPDHKDVTLTAGFYDKSGRFVPLEVAPQPAR